MKIWSALGALTALALGAAAGACSAGSRASFGGGSDDDGSGGHDGSGAHDGTGASGTGGSIGFDSGAGGGVSSPCSEESKLVYVVGVGNELYSFYPPTLALKQIGIIACPQGGGLATPFSMAVARNDVAWVLFNDGRMYNVDIKSAACSATGFVPNQVSGFSLFGMGFVSDTPGSNAETLYLGSYDGIGIARLNLQTLGVEPVGSYDKVSGPAELTGTGEARLFGFFLSDPEVVAEIDKSTSKILSIAPQPSVEIGSAWAFAFWGGDFWLFTCPGMACTSSQIDRYRPADGTTVTVLQNAGLRIVGAGVSTCAPVTPPK
ncbi:MAG: hypothetical protein HY744_08490 [Deltaproteobacteria bacterium]|nr:hypothetical protein [Deltaproteobacteria bacterium]